MIINGDIMDGGQTTLLARSPVDQQSLVVPISQVCPDVNENNPFDFDFARIIRKIVG